MLFDFPVRDTVLEVDLDKLAQNIQAIRAHLQPHARYMAVVKANGYGHGAREMLPTMLENGVDELAVATLNEAILLREAGAVLPIMILGNTPPSFLDLVCKYNIDVTVVSKAHADELRSYAAANGRILSVHIAVDTGMHRIGIAWDEPETILAVLQYPEFNIKGVFTHFTQTTVEADYIQFERYKKVLDAIQNAGLPMPTRHVCASQPCALMTDCHLDMVRVGRVMYGLSDFPELATQTIALFRSKIVSLRTIQPGEQVGYNYIWTAQRPSIIATLPFGSVDGYSCQLIGKGEVTIRGKRAPMVGRVCMDQCMIDVTDIPDAAVGDDVYVWGDGSHGEYTAIEFADMMGITRGEMLSRISVRVPRVYKKGGQIVSVTDLF